MELILAIDLSHGLVVHGKGGDRFGYRPLTWGASPTADPVAFIRHIKPRFLYIADLDRIEGTGTHDETVKQCAKMVECCFVDRGCRSPRDMLPMEGVCNVIGTETAGQDLQAYTGGYLSIDIRDGRVLPSGIDPIAVLTRAENWSFDGCIILNITDVGTSNGPDAAFLEEMRMAYRGRLIYGGGVSSGDDLIVLRDAGFDGVILATALHKGRVPLTLIRSGSFC